MKQIFIKNNVGKMITLDHIVGDETVIDIKKLYFKKEGMKNQNPNHFKFIFAGKTHTDDETLIDMGAIIPEKNHHPPTIDITYKVGPTFEKKYSKNNDSIQGLIMRTLNADEDDKSVVVIPGCVLGSERYLIENLVMPDSEYYNKHDLFKQQLPLPILKAAYESNKNVHIYLIDPEFNLSVNAINDVRNIYDKIESSNKVVFSEETSHKIDIPIGFYLEETYEIFNEIKLKDLDEEKVGLYVYLYIIPFTIDGEELKSIIKMLENIEHYIYLHPSAAASTRLTKKEITTNSSITKVLEQWHRYDIRQRDFTSSVKEGGNNKAQKGLTPEGMRWANSAAEDMKKRQNANIPEHYTSGLSRKDKKKQQRYLRRSSINYKKGEYTPRPKLKSFKNKKSSWTIKFEKKYGEDVKTYKEISKATGIPVPALKAVVKKGMGAYYSSGSRPNQTAESWGKARMYSYIMGGPTRKVDHHITEKYNVKFKV